MKPLTIEQLKSLEAGDWVWISRLNNKRASGYVTDINFTERMFTCKSVNRVSTTARIADYGTKWLAYKNKEQAETKGEIVELPCKTETLHIGDTVYYIQEYFNDATLQHERHIKRTTIDYIAKDYIEVNHGVWLSINDFWLIPEEAERRLAELKGEV